jgi:hypothetical protein
MQKGKSDRLEFSHSAGTHADASTSQFTYVPLHMPFKVGLQRIALERSFGINADVAPTGCPNEPIWARSAGRQDTLQLCDTSSKPATKVSESPDYSMRRLS